MNDLKSDKSTKKEVIDGVTIIYHGIFKGDPEELHHPDPLGKTFVFNGKWELVTMYDADGNRFYTNCSSENEAYQVINRLAEEGITAVIGPKAPYLGLVGLIPNPIDTDVGVYVVQVPKKSDDFFSSKIR